MTSESVNPPALTIDEAELRVKMRLDALDRALIKFPKSSNKVLYGCAEDILEFLKTGKFSEASKTIN